MMPAKAALIITALCLLPAVGCQSGGPRGGAGGGGKGHPMPAPREPEKPRPAQPMPIDPALQAAARSELAKGLQAADATVRIHALEAMRDTMGAEAAPAILRALDDPQAEVRFAAAMAAGELALPAAKPKLLRMVDDPNANIRIAVRFALHRLGETSFSHDLEEMAVSLSATARFTTAMVLGRMGEPSATKILRVLRFDRHPAVRQQASDSLYRLGDDAGLSDLIGLAASQHPDDMMIGILGLTSKGDQRLTEHVRAGLTADWPEVQLVAARAVGLVGKRPRYAGDKDYVYDLGLPIVDAHAKSNDHRHRALAALALGGIARADRQPTLSTLLRDEHQGVRIAAATAALQLGKKAGA